jgi:hypothetical protein
MRTSRLLIISAILAITACRPKQQNQTTAVDTLSTPSAAADTSGAYPDTSRLPADTTKR